MNNLNCYHFALGTELAYKKTDSISLSLLNPFAITLKILYLPKCIFMSVGFHFYLIHTNKVATDLFDLFLIKDYIYTVKAYLSTIGLLKHD